MNTYKLLQLAGIRIGFGLVIFLGFMLMPLSTIHAQSFGDQLQAAVADLEPEARVEFEGLLSDPETFGAVLDDFGVSPEMADSIIDSVFTDRSPNGNHRKAKWTNRSDYVEKLSKRLNKIENRLDSKAAEIADKAASEALKVANKLATKAAEADAKADAKAAEEAAKEAGEGAGGKGKGKNK